MPKLTARQLDFAEWVASGLSNAEAYRRAYNAENMKVETIANKAYKLVSRDDIRTIIEAKRKELADKALWTREKALSMLVDIACTAKENVAESVSLPQGEAERYNAAAQNVAIKAIEQANKMCGFNEPVKLAHSGALTVSLSKELEEWAR